MEITINKFKPSFTIYIYDGSVKIDDKIYTFELKDTIDDTEITWMEQPPIVKNLENLENEIIQKYQE